MAHWALRFLGCTAVVFTVSLSNNASALTTSTVNVKCVGAGGKLQAAIDAVVAGTIATINLSGTCIENITVPASKTIKIIGGSSATLQPSNNSLPVLISNGNTTIQKVALTNALGAADSLVQSDGGSLTIISSDLSSPNTRTVFGANDRGVGHIINSRLIGGTEGAVDAWGASEIKLRGDPNYPNGPTNLPETYISAPGVAAVSCTTGSTLIARAVGATGKITVANSRTGFFVGQCTLDLRNRTASQPNFNFSITGMSGNNYDAAIGGSNSNINLIGINLANNADWGLNVSLSQVQIDGSNFDNNTDLASGDINVSLNSEVHITNYNGNQSTFPNASGGQSFLCGPQSNIDIDSNAFDPTGVDMGNYAGCVTFIN